MTSLLNGLRSYQEQDYEKNACLKFKADNFLLVVKSLKKYYIHIYYH